MVYVNLYMSSYEEGIKVFICYCAVCVGGGLVREFDTLKSEKS